MGRLVVAALIVSLAPVAAAAGASRTKMASVYTLLRELIPQSILTGPLIRETYRPYLDLLVLNGYDDLHRALGNGGLVVLPEAERFNVRVRLDGSSPIGEKDLRNQASYLSARPATIGCVLLVASRVTSGPVEVTSLVRHSEYQDALRTSNVNATTEVPMHTMGLAFDIALMHTPLETVHEIRDVLEQMRDAGDILFVGERHQLVFHVVPHPSRLGYFADVYATAIRTGQPSGVPFDPTLQLNPHVVTEVANLRPVPRFEAEWWAADNVTVDLAVEVTPER